VNTVDLINLDFYTVGRKPDKITSFNMIVTINNY
jgi:hypothetical protein